MQKDAIKRALHSFIDKMDYGSQRKVYFYILGLKKTNNSPGRQQSPGKRLNSMADTEKQAGAGSIPARRIRSKGGDLVAGIASE